MWPPPSLITRFTDRLEYSLNGGHTWHAFPYQERLLELLAERQRLRRRRWIWSLSVLAGAAGLAAAAALFI